MRKINYWGVIGIILITCSGVFAVYKSFISGKNQNPSAGTSYMLPNIDFWNASLKSEKGPELELSNGECLLNEPNPLE